MSFEHFQLDLETVGKSAGCAVLSIGLCGFDYEADTVGDVYYDTFDLGAQLRAGLAMEPSTMEWWGRQGAEAQAVLVLALAKHTNTNAEKITDMTRWLHTQAGGSMSGVRMWANGANFDFPILRALCEAIAMPLPWQFYQEACHRTLKGFPTLAPRKKGHQYTAPATIKHNAGWDAEYQAREAVVVLRRLALLNDSKYTYIPPTALEKADELAGQLEELKDGALGMPSETKVAHFSSRMPDGPSMTKSVK